MSSINEETRQGESVIVNVPKGGSYTLQEMQDFLDRITSGSGISYRVNDAEEALHATRLRNAEPGRNVVEAEERLSGVRADAIYSGATAEDAADTLQVFTDALLYKGKAALAADYLDDADRYIMLGVCEAVANRAGLELAHSADVRPGDAAWERSAAAYLASVRN